MPPVLLLFDAFVVCKVAFQKYPGGTLIVGTLVGYGVGNGHDGAAVGFGGAQQPKSKPQLLSHPYPAQL